jgi:hypothetical protein
LMRGPYEPGYRDREPILVSVSAARPGVKACEGKVTERGKVIHPTKTISSVRKSEFELLVRGDGKFAISFLTTNCHGEQRLRCCVCARAKRRVAWTRGGEMANSIEKPVSDKPTYRDLARVVTSCGVRRLLTVCRPAVKNGHTVSQAVPRPA